jgi:hypothetical protein
MVSCGVGGGVAELRKPQITRSIRVRRMIFGELAQSWLPPASFISAPKKLILRRTTCHATRPTRDLTRITELVARGSWYVLGGGCSGTLRELTANFRFFPAIF